jgi:hypothetical protein
MACKGKGGKKGKPKHSEEISEECLDMLYSSIRNFEAGRRGKLVDIDAALSLFGIEAD